MRWRVIAVLFVVRIGLGFHFQTLGSVSSDLVDTFGLDYADIGVLVGLFMAPGLFLSVPAGASGRYLSDRWLSGLGMLVLALGGLVSALAVDPWLIGAGRMVSGAGFVLSNLYMTKMTSDWFSGRELATAMGIFVMSWPLGIALGQVGHEWIAGTAGWRWAFLAASALLRRRRRGLGPLVPTTAQSGRHPPARRLQIEPAGAASHPHRSTGLGRVSMPVTSST